MNSTIRRWTRLTLGVVVIGVLAGAAIWSNQAQQKSGKNQVLLDRPMRAFGAVHPRLSPDGKNIVFTYHGSIWRMPVEGGTMRRLFDGNTYASEPCWSPNGKRIAFLDGRGWDAGQLKIIDAANGKLLPSKIQVLGRGRIAFTPDGKHIIGNLRTARKIETLRTYNIASGELTTVLRLRSLRHPWDISPDGKWIAFITTMDVPGQQGGNDGPQADVWKVKIDGGDPEKIVRFPARIHDLIWSADNKSLFASSELGGVHNDLWRIDLADPQRPAKLTFGQADEERPSISKNGRWLLHTDNHEGCPALVLRDLRSGGAKTLTMQNLDFGSPTGRLTVNLDDKETGKPATGRVAIQRIDGGSFHAPPGTLWRTHRNHAHFYVTGQNALDLPAGEYKVRVFHGPEYQVAEKLVQIRAGAESKLNIDLDRWTNPTKDGWYSGDNHIHANYGYGEYYNTPATMRQMCAGEDLHVCNFMVANSDGNGVFDREFFRGRPDVLSSQRNILYWNEEFRSTIWGHLTLVNLKQVVEPVYTGFKDTTNPWDIPTIAAIADRTRLQGGVVNYTHPSARIDDLYKGAYTAKGLPIFAALGKIDTMDIMGSNDRASSALYHKLLNCGFRIGASAGTDCFLNRIRSYLPGAERVYVKVNGPLTYEKWIDGLKKGRSFATNGPMLKFSVNDLEPGETLQLAQPGLVRVRARISSQYPLKKIELLHNGSAVIQQEPANQGMTTNIDRKILVKKSGWMALRAVGPSHPDVEGVAVYAHTSPVYVKVGNTPAGSAEDARYFLKWIDRLWTTVQARERIPSAELKAQVRQQIEEARRVYGNIGAR